MTHKKTRRFSLSADTLRILHHLGAAHGAAVPSIPYCPVKTIGMTC